MKGSEVFAKLVSPIGGTMAQIREGSPTKAKGQASGPPILAQDADGEGLARRPA
jgi:hypothetical protein